MLRILIFATESWPIRISGLSYWRTIHLELYNGFMKDCLRLCQETGKLEWFRGMSKIKEILSSNVLPLTLTLKLRKYSSFSNSIKHLSHYSMIPTPNIAGKMRCWFNKRNKTQDWLNPNWNPHWKEKIF